MRLHPIRRRRRALAALVVAAVSLGSVAVLATGAGAAPPLESPATPNLQINVLSPVDDLVAGNTVTFNVQSTSPLGLNGVETKLCQTGFTSYNTSTYGYSSGTRCVRQVGIIPGTGLDADLGTAGLQPPTYQIDPTAYDGSPQTTANFSFVVGTGSVQWAPTAASASSLTCGPGNPCDMVVKVDTPSGTTYYIQTLTFLAAPGAPTLNSATPGNEQVSLGWTAGGGGVAANYEVRVAPIPTAGPCAGDGLCPLAPGTSLVVTGLTNFTAYTFDVRGVNAAGTGPFSTQLGATPVPGGATALTAVPGDGRADLTWVPAVGASGYRVTVYDDTCTTPVGGLGPFSVAGGGSSTYTVLGLDNGTEYCFTVAADFGGGNFSAESNTVLVTPGGAVIYQTINVTRPTGTLVISQRCSGLPTDPRTGDFDPSNPDLVPPYGDLLTPATRCQVNLHGPRLNHLVGSVTTADMRTVYDANTTNGGTTVVSATAAFTANDVGQLVRGSGIPAGARITAVGGGGTQAVLDTAATATLDDGELTILGRTLAVPAGAAVAGDVGKDVSGIQVPGGSRILAVVNAGGVTLVDISQPANNPAVGETVRIWDEPATPARLVTSGPNAGRFLQATGRMAQVYVVDYRDTDAGWAATGQVDDFCDGSGPAGGPAHLNPAAGPRACLAGDNTFSGNRLGWTPKVRRFSGSPTMAVTTGPLVNPGGSLGSAPQTLASAIAGQGLGVARLDADFNLLIPVEVDGGDYQSTLTLTVA